MPLTLICLLAEIAAFCCGEVVSRGALSVVKLKLSSCICVRGVACVEMRERGGERGRGGEREREREREGEGGREGGMEGGMDRRTEGGREGENLSPGPLCIAGGNLTSNH
jgi:hypothetical protein